MNFEIENVSTFIFFVACFIFVFGMGIALIDEWEATRGTPYGSAQERECAEFCKPGEYYYSAGGFGASDCLCKTVDYHPANIQVED